MKKICVAGPLSPRGLGDALQYYITLKLLNKMLPEADITFICQDLKNGLSVFKNLKLNSHLLDSNCAGHGAVFRRLLHAPFLRKYPLKSDKKSAIKDQTDEVNKVLNVIRALGRKYAVTYRIDKYFSMSIMRPFSFDGGILGGYTLHTRIYHCILNHEILRSIVKGPLVTSPISVSKLALEHVLKNASLLQRSLILKRLKQSLEKFDFIYTRGPHSIETLRNYLDVNGKKVGMALDSGFGLRLFHHDIFKPKVSEKKALKILIFPRKDYFYTYDKEYLYKLYLDALVALIMWLSKNFDARVCLAMYYQGDQVVIYDILRLLGKHCGVGYLKRLEIAKPDNLVDACKLESSADLVIASRMHGGIAALGLGIPALFVLPLVETKVLDVLSFLGLDINSFLVDMFDADALKSENIINKIGNILENLDYYKKTVESAVKKALPTLELPVKTLINLLG